MSVSGPCAWVSTVQSPITAPSSAITNSWAAVAWNNDQSLLKSRVDLSALSGVGANKQDRASPVSMQSAASQAANTYQAHSVTDSSNTTNYSGEGVPFNGIKDQQSNEQGGSLSKSKLERLNYQFHAMGDSHPNEDVPNKIKPEGLEEIREDDKDHSEINAASSDDDGAGSSVADEKKSSIDAKIDKKKMKRFRLTHNQTRFLMSEFTRQAHPDAAHRERLSREIPGLTPRQVQVWFQNRRAKLKRLTSNDRERMLKSRALPDDFDTTQVLRTPFGSKGAEGPGLLTDGLSRLNDDEYMISPLSSASTNGPGYQSATSDRGFESYQNRGAAATVPDLRSNRGTYPFPRSSSFSESSFNATLQYPGRLGHSGVQYRRPMDYIMNRPANGMIVGYSQHRPMEGSASPNGQPEHQMPYAMDSSNPQMHGYQPTLSMPAPMSSHMQTPGRTMPALQHIPVSEAPDYRSYSYEHPYSMGTGIPYTSANASSLSLPASFPPETGHVAVSSSPEDRINQPHVLDPLRGKYGQGYDYANYL
ncbi:hypothetical protein BDV18DRAFT_33450 [Aspergillus unguis]